MKKIIYWIIGIVVLMSFLSIAAFYFTINNTPANTTSTSTSTASGFPVVASGNSSGSDNLNSTSSDSMLVKALDGTSVSTKNFLSNGVTIPDKENPGTYLLAGTLGYCANSTECTTGTSDDYNISYDKEANSFTIVLLKEPIGTSRTEAEQFLTKDLGITDQELCTLNYYVGTPYWVNEMYDSKNLGFDSCNGATALPQ